MKKIKDFLNQIDEGFTGDLNTGKLIVLICYLVGLGVLEVLSYKGIGKFPAITARIWLAFGVLCFFAFFISVIKHIVNDIKNKAILSIIGILIPVGILFFLIGNVMFSDINPDAAQQVAAGINSFKQPDWSYTGKAFLGYASRQYLIAAIPSVLFGRSIAMLQLGFGYPFIIGLVMMYFSIRDWAKKEGISEKYALIPVFTFMSFSFITEYYMNFEQAITPVALTMIALALFIRMYLHTDAITVIAFGWVINLFCNSYTPVIASLGLLVAAFGVLILSIVIGYFKGSRAKSGKKSSGKRVTGRTIAGKDAARRIIITVTLLLYSGIMLYATTLGKREDRLLSFRKDLPLIRSIWESWSEFFMNKNAWFLGLFSTVLLIYIALAFIGRLTFWDFMVSCWVLGVIVFSNILEGYTTYQKCWILQRNMIILPVISATVFMAVVRLIKRHSVKLKAFIPVLWITCMLALCIGKLFTPHQSFTYFKYIQPVKYMYSYMEDTLKENGLKPEDKFTVVLYTDSVLCTNIGDYAKYLFPNAETRAEKYDAITENPTFTVKTFVFSQDSTLGVFANASADSKTFKNARYNDDVIWYRRTFNVN